MPVQSISDWKGASQKAPQGRGFLRESLGKLPGKMAGMVRRLLGRKKDRGREEGPLRESQRVLSQSPLEKVGRAASAVVESARIVYQMATRIAQKTAKVVKEQVRLDRISNPLKRMADKFAERWSGRTHAGRQDQYTVSAGGNIESAHDGGEASHASGRAHVHVSARKRLRSLVQKVVRRLNPRARVLALANDGLRKGAADVGVARGTGLGTRRSVGMSGPSPESQGPQRGGRGLGTPADRGRQPAAGAAGGMGQQ